MSPAQTRDPRLTLARPDLADAALKGKVPAERYAETRKMRVTAATLPLRSRPDHAAGFTTELWLGEAFHVCEARDGWAWGQAARDGYVGYAPVSGLKPATEAPTHRVAALSTNLYARPELKAPAVGWAPMGALFAGTVEGKFLVTAHGAVPLHHLADIGDAAHDYVAVAEMFLGAPYLWGGGSARGLDCSGLVQGALIAAGRPCPRDSDQQARMGSPLPGPEALRRGDLVFWKGHVGIMRDAGTLLHANAFHMAVFSEPLDGAMRRIEAAGEGAPTAFRRILES